MQELIKEIESYIKELLNKKLSSEFVYHNIRHTLDVVNSAEEISAHSELTPKEKVNLIIAAWFHDAGYTVNVKNHEEESVNIAEAFLKVKNISAEKIAEIKQLILSTKIPQAPQTEPEKILCDADLLYIGTNDLLNRITLLRTEWESTLKKSFSDEEWIIQNINFINSNAFHTDYAKNKFDKIRNVNLSILREKLKEAKSKKP
jgi:predicted metal-dependent HD superfamily phosphohydrolase